MVSKLHFNKADKLKMQNEPWCGWLEENAGEPSERAVMWMDGWELRAFLTTAVQTQGQGDVEIEK